MNTIEHVEAILSSSEWNEFELEFEEGWTDDPDVPTLADREKHRHVASVLAHVLNERYVDQETCYKYLGHHKVHVAYAELAKIMYPDDKIWYGDHADDPEYWLEVERCGFHRIGEFSNDKPRSERGI